MDCLICWGQLNSTLIEVQPFNNIKMLVKTVQGLKAVWDSLEVLLRLQVQKPGKHKTVNLAAQFLT